jgi:hypothetical protein
VASVLGFLGFSKEVKAEDLGVNNCSLLNSKALSFDIIDVKVIDRMITITTKRSLITLPLLSLISEMVYNTDPIHGTINSTKNGLKQKIEFKNYSLRSYGLSYDGSALLLPEIEKSVVIVIDLVPYENL